MPSLLGLPQELRDKILHLVVTSSRTPPKDPSKANPQRRERLQDLDYTGWFGDAGVSYVRRPNRAEDVALLLVNRQLHTETLAIIDLLQSKICYDLDIMLVDETYLWPTWLCAPALSRRIDTVTCTLRIFGSTKGDSGFSGSCGGPPLITWSFYNLLERFVRVGPVGTQADRKKDRKISIQHLIIQVKTPAVPPEMLTPPTERRWHFLQRLRRKDGVNYIMHPEYLETFISSGISSLLWMGYYTANFGKIVFERVGTIQIYLDSELRADWDLGKLLSELTFTDSFGEYPREDRPQIFKEWKDHAYKTRVELGLPVISEGDDLEDNNASSSLDPWSFSSRANLL